MTWWAYLIQGGVIALEAYLGKTKYGSILGAVLPQVFAPSIPVVASKAEEK